MRQAKGFTLLELLVAAAIMIVILAALGGLFVSTIRANQINTRASEGQQNAEAAIQLLKSEVALAGYRGTDSGAGTRPFVPPDAPTLVVTTETSARDRITVRFFEDRYVTVSTSCPTIPCERTLTFGVNSTNELTRQLDGGNNFAVVEGITGLKVTNYSSLSATGTVTNSTTMPADRKTLRGITVRLTFTDTTTKNVAIALSNPQQ